MSVKAARKTLMKLSPRLSEIFGLFCKIGTRERVRLQKISTEYLESSTNYIVLCMLVLTTIKISMNLDNFQSHVNWQGIQK